ncbi:TPA: Ltp family lipoprotein [Streptococcus agalactiae]|nr:immunity protein [Streptococcus agalactiae]HEO1892439.1 Ltp family lipoprotein [Streptococcus agalactiae]
MKKSLTIGLLTLSTVALVGCSNSSSVAPSTSKNDKTVQSTTTSSSKEEKKVPMEYKTASTKAEQYLKTIGMSKLGLEKQLTEFEKFSPEAAKYAVDNVKANWNEQALKKGKEYVKTVAMSPEAVREQLVSFEQFTQEEADYAVNNLDK